MNQQAMVSLIRELTDELELAIERNSRWDLDYDFRAGEELVNRARFELDTHREVDAL